MLGLCEQFLPLSAKKRETGAKRQDLEVDGDEGETDCSGGWKVGGQSGWRSWRDEMSNKVQQVEWGQQAFH